jgi:hypothetical protein
MTPAERVSAAGLVALRGYDRVVERPLQYLRAKQVTGSVPWRTVRSRHGQRHHCGRYWCATMDRHVVYESRLELARLMLADFDLRITAICAQPFLIRARVSGRVRRHVPDFFLVSAEGSVTVVNVKPAARLSDPVIAEALAWPAALIEEHGWTHEVWSGDDPVLLANVRLLASQRRAGLVPEGMLAEVLGACSSGITVQELVLWLQGSIEPWLAKPAVIRLLWQQRLTADLRRPLDGGSELVVAHG